ncbi:MAG: hypothetical protein LN413_02750, partial [Candidatus Thermoplasmatota archaeon]|nr:hypothetical protein [Candidatus Thermoplasmatota archaeon]
MPVTSLELTTIEGKRFAKTGERLKNVRVDHNSTVTRVHPVDEASAVDFRFTVNYSGVGVIQIEGSLHFEGEASLPEVWEKTGNMPEAVASEIHTAIMSYCIQEAVVIAKDLRL